MHTKCMSQVLKGRMNLRDINVDGRTMNLRKSAYQVRDWLYLAMDRKQFFLSCGCNNFHCLSYL